MKRASTVVRNPAVAGYFYPGTAAEINKMMGKFIDKKTPKEYAIGALVPHAGYIYSGAVTGAVLSHIAFKDAFIIMGPTHTGYGEPFSVWPEGVWKTPLGSVEVDSELARKITGFSQYLAEDYEAHNEREHAVEVQIPFLQYIKPDVKIVPMVISEAPPEIHREIGHAIAKAIKELHKSVFILASGDMTHYESADAAREKDMKAVDAMLKMNDDEFTRRYNDLHITMCAHAPVAVLMAAAKELGAKTAELVKYTNSGAATRDFSQVVAYAGVIFK